MTTTRTWGGPRTPGPGKRLGRPRQQDAARRHTSIWVTPEQLDQLRALGDGNVSAGVRRLLEEHHQLEVR